jgi:hypothetical protein
MSYDYEDFAYPPNGGRVKLILLGLIIPGIIAYFAIRAWLTKEAYWPSRRGQGLIVHGESAQALAVVYLSVAAFFHFRWFWGLIQADRVFQIGTVCSLLTFLGALIHALCTL